MRKKDINVIYIGLIMVLLVIILKQVFLFFANLTTFQWALLILIVIGLILISRIHGQNIRLKEAEERRLELERRSNIEKLLKLTSREFEQYICDLFIELGFEANLTKSTGDGGKDIFIYKNEFFAIVECKRYSRTNEVSRPKIQVFHSALIDCEADKGFFITTSDFTEPAERYVLDKPITLINGEKLVEMIQQITENKIINIEDIISKK